MDIRGFVKVHCDNEIFQKCGSVIELYYDTTFNVSEEAMKNQAREKAKIYGWFITDYDKLYCPGCAKKLSLINSNK